MAQHKLKIWPEHYFAIIEGRKRAEFRIDDREPRFQEGDELVLQPFDPITGRFLEKPDLSRRVSHVARGDGFGGIIPKGYAMLSLADPPTRFPCRKCGHLWNVEICAKACAETDCEWSPVNQAEANR